jgi:hypothetical protein
MVSSLSAERLAGVGVLNLDIQNKCLLSKWLFSLCYEVGIWQELMRNKYLKNITLSQVLKQPCDSSILEKIPLTNFEDLFNNWSKEGGPKQNSPAICWSLWLTRNDSFLINEHKNHFCRSYSRKHIGFNFGVDCSALRTK